MKLVAKHIRTLRVHKKLAERFLESFKILVRINQNAYKLDLSTKYKRLYYIFHISLLEAYYI